MTYDTRGRITNNTDLGDYVYDTNSKYRLKEITPNATGENYFQAHPTQQISYNAFKKPIDIDETGHGKVSFEYSPMMNRSHAYYGGDHANKLERRYRKHYSTITGTEIVEDTQTTSTKIITYVGGDAYTAPIAHIKRTVDTPVDEYHYLHRDYLGSILAITDADGDVIEERQFGAWGLVDRFLNISTGGTVFNHQSLLDRGYTGHEHFFEVSLIHMNGRIYDPQVGRFLSPDNYIQEPFNTQNYNRYGYVLNNPLMYTDPSGETFGGPDRPGGGWFGLLYFGLRSLFGGGNSYGNYQSAAPIPTNTGNGLTTPRAPNPNLSFDPPAAQDNTSFLQGWNRTVGKFNNNFWGSFQDFMNKPIQGAANYFNQTMLGVAQLAHDVVPGLSGVTGIENKTGNAIVAAGETISNIPNMTNEQLGSLSGGTSIFAMQFLVTRKLSIGNVSRLGTATRSGNAYDGVRSASAYLQNAGVPREFRKQILQSFEIETLSLRTAGNSTFGLRFYGGNANEIGRYLFPTFTNYTNRSGLALPYIWNSMSGFTQFQIRPGTHYIFGRVASQGGIFIGGSNQMYINNLDDLIAP